MNKVKPCPECDGDGYLIYERAVPDRVNGGRIEETEDDCWNCGGSGEIEDWDEEDYA